VQGQTVRSPQDGLPAATRTAEQWTSTARGRHLSGRRNRDTEPEVLLRRALHAAGYRFRVQRRIAPGCTADLVLPRLRLAVFVDGDFWHGCPQHHPADNFTGPNADLWRDKIARTRARDQRATELAEAAGWHVVRVWECAVLADPPGTARRLVAAVPDVTANVECWQT
jgi:DNA mismatch endonuclease (patch repair protein)